MMHTVSTSRATFAEATGASTRAGCADYANYEACKAEWRASNPGATPQQYEAAIRAIAEKCGV